MEVRQCCFIALLFSTALELCALLTLSVLWHAQRTSHKESVVCLARENFIFADVKYDFLKDLEEKDDEYCGFASVVLQRIAEKRVVEKYDSNLSPEFTNVNLTDFGCVQSQEKNSVLKLQDVTSYAKPVQGKATKLFWRSVPITANSFLYLEKEGAVFIRKTGRYFVSSLLTFKMGNVNRNKTIGGREELTFRHFVNLISFGRRLERTLLETVTSSCNMAAEVSEQTITSEAVFDLEENDRIFVATSHPGDLIPGKGRNHLAIHLI